MLTRRDIRHIAIEIPATLGLFFVIALVVVPHDLLMSTTGLIAYAGLGVFVIWFTVSHKIQRRQRLIKGGTALQTNHKDQKLLRAVFSPAAIVVCALLVAGLLTLKKFY